MAEAFASLNGRTVVGGSLSIPRSGCWHADVSVDAPDGAAFVAGAALALGSGASAWAGAFLRAAPVYGRYDARIVGGKGGLAKAIAGASYVNVPASVVLADILAGASEALSPTADAALLTANLRAWSRLAGSASCQLTHLLSSLSLSWRVLADGRVWVGRESWPPAATFAYDVLEQHPREGRWVLGTTEGYALLPGTTFESQHVEYVEHHLSDDALTTQVWFS